MSQVKNERKKNIVKSIVATMTEITQDGNAKRTTLLCANVTTRVN